MTHLWPDIPWHWSDCLSNFWIDRVLWQCGRSNSSQHASSPWKRRQLSYDGWQWPCGREKDRMFPYWIYYFLRPRPYHLAIRAASNHWNLSFWCWICCHEAWNQNPEGTEIDIRSVWWGYLCLDPCTSMVTISAKWPTHLDLNQP
jgi:hypothetical protein